MSSFAWDSQGNLYSMEIVNGALDVNQVSTNVANGIAPIVPVEDLPLMFIHIKQDLNIVDNSKDDLILRYINRVARKILNYCNISQVPRGLYDIIEEKVVSIMSVGGGTLVEGSGAVKKVSRGDTTVEYDVGATVVGGTKYKENILDDVRAQLNAYRKVKCV